MPSAGAQLERAFRWVSHKLSVGRPGFLRRDAHRGYDVGGRETLVGHFHRLRDEHELPPVLVFEGPRGIGKSDLLNRCQRTLRERDSSRFAEEVVASVNLTTDSRDPVSFFVELRRQLHKDSSLFRRASTPRFDAMLSRLERESGRSRFRPPSALSAGVLGTVDAGATYASQVTFGAPPPVKPSLLWRLRRVLVRLAKRWWGAPSTRWLSDYMRHRVPDPASPGSPSGPFMDALYRGLGDAMAADIAAMHVRRWWLKVSKVTVFVYAYDQVESQPRERFLADFARRAREVRAPLFLVVGCRSQRLWSAMLERDGDARDYGAFRAGAAVEIYPLGPLTPEQGILELDGMRVPAHLCALLAELSQGLPLALRLFGEIFGGADAPVVREDWQRSLLERIPKLDGEIDDGWVKAFCTEVAPAVLEGLTPETRRHVLAAAALRTFDRPFLAEVLGESFSGASYEELIAGPLTHAARPSRALGAEQSFRVRSFVRDFLAASDGEREALRRWHARAVAHLQRLQEEAPSDRKAELQADVIYHRFTFEPDVAAQLLQAEWAAAYQAGRLGLCEQLVDAAHDAARYSRSHAAGILALAGRLHLGAGAYALAESRLRQAADLAPPADRDTQASVQLALATALRRQYRHHEARQHLAQLERIAGGDPVLAFHVPWSKSLIAKGQGDLNGAVQLSAQASRALTAALDALGEQAEARTARLGVAPLAHRDADLARHDADVARRAGRWEQCRDRLEHAARGYADQGNVLGSTFTDVVRSRLLRMEGRVQEAFALVEASIRTLSQPESNDVVGALLGARNAAQACLQLEDLDAAEAHARALLEARAPVYPPGRVIGHYVLGEVARLRGDAATARARHEEALSGGGAPGDLFERHYVRLALAELDRAAGDADAVAGVVRALTEIDAVRAHPTLLFWACLTGARSAGDPARRAEWLDRAGTAIADLARHDGAVLPEALALNAHRALDGGSPPPLIMSLP